MFDDDHNVILHTLHLSKSMVIKVIVFNDNKGLLFDKQGKSMASSAPLMSVSSDVEILRKEGRIVGTMIGKMRGIDCVWLSLMENPQGRRCLAMKEHYRCY